MVDQDAQLVKLVEGMAFLGLGALVKSLDVSSSYGYGVNIIPFLFKIDILDTGQIGEQLEV